MCSYEIPEGERDVLPKIENKATSRERHHTYKTEKFFFETTKHCRRII